MQTLLTSSTKTNGITPIFPIDDTRNWRQEVMSAVLQCAANDGDAAYCLLEALRQQIPDRTVHMVYQNRSDMFRTISRISENMHPFVQPVLDHNDDESQIVDPRPVYGWWEIRTTGEQTPLEFIAIPWLNDSSHFAIVGEDDEQCNRFVERLHKEMFAVYHRCRRFQGRWRDDPELAEEASQVRWDDIVLAPELLTDIRQTVDQFFASKETFRSIGFPWRRGVLLIGPPGTGKTMVCKAAAAAHPEVPFLYVGEVRNTHNLNAIFSHAREAAPCILAFEDMDGFINQHNRTLFLNELDGFRNNDGILIIASSNHPGQIDEALLKRPSRFDRVYHIGLPAKQERMEYCRRFLKKLPNLAPDFAIESLAETVASFTDGFTPAFLKEAFLAAILQLAHEGKTVLDDAYYNAVSEQIETLRKYLKKAKNPEHMADMLSSTGSGESIGFLNH